MTAERKRTLLSELVVRLCAERSIEPPENEGTDDLWATFRALVNTRPPAPADAGLLAVQDELLRSMIEDVGTATLDDAQVSPHDDRLLLWRGDITTLAVDAVVNAANSQMLGCWAPGHHCVDNAIHTFSGIQLRLECARLMQAQGHEEPTGAAMMTPAYNLPSKHIIHTVGPVAGGHPTDLHRRQLASCYTSCLELAAGSGLRSIAFCSVSTGVFGFPQAEAASIAVETVRTWLDTHEHGMRVLFNVFSAQDERIYRGLLDL